MIRRYRSWIIGPTFAGLVVSVVVAFISPDMYRSTAVMRITPQRVSDRLVPSEITQHMNDRLNAMEQEILSRGQLAALIQRPDLDLYKKEKAQKPLEDIIQDMRNKYIQIRMLSVPGADMGGKATSAFSISFDYPERYRAKQVVDLLVAKFTEQNSVAQRDNIKLSSQFLDDELKSASDRLNDLGQKITKFQMENQGKLPEQAAANFSMVNSLQQNVSTETEALSRATNEKLMQESRLTELQNNFAFYSQRAEDTVMVGGSAGQMAVRNQRLIDLQRQSSDLQQTLSEFRKSYKDDYPPIKNLVAKIDNIQKQIEDVEKAEQAANANVNTAATAPTPVKVTNPQVAQHLEELKNQMATVKTSILTINNEIQARQQHIVDINRRIAEYQKRIEAAPLSEQQYARLNADYSLAKQQYDEFSKRRELAQTSDSMVQHQAGENLEVLDTATLPESSFEPNRNAWIGIGTAVGLMLGVMLAGAKEVKNTSLKNLKDVRAYTNLPVLSSIPLLENALLMRRKRRLFWLAWSTAFIVGAMAMSGAMYYHFFGKS